MIEDPEFLTVDDVLDLHRDQIEQYGGAESQAFLDGNKRVGLAAAYVFLQLNGYVLSRDEDRLYDAMIAIGTHQLDKAGLAKA